MQLNLSPIIHNVRFLKGFF